MVPFEYKPYLDSKTFHNNWYQSRSIRGGRRHADDRENQNLYSVGVRECKNSSIRCPLTAETRQDLQNDFTRVISLMEGLITRINNNIAHQAQFAKQSQEKYLESKKKFDARFDAILNRISTKALKTTHEKEAVDLEKCDEVMEKAVDLKQYEEVMEKVTGGTDADKKEVADMEEAEKASCLTKNNGEIGQSVADADLGPSKEKNNEHEEECEASPEMAVIEGEIVEPTVVITVAMAEKCEGAQNDFSVSKFHNRSANVYGMSVGISTCRPENPQRLYVQRSTEKSAAIEFVGFRKKRKQRRGRMRRSTGRWKHLPTVFPVAHTVIGEYGGEEWPANLLWRRRRKRRHRWEEDWASMYGEGLGFQTVFSENRDLRVVGVRNCDGKVGDSGGDRRRRRETRCWKWRYGDEQFCGYGVETRKSAEGMSSKTTVMAVTFNKEGKGKEGNRESCGRFKKVTHSLMLFTDTRKASHLLIFFSIKARGKGVISHIHDNFADVIHPIFCPFLLFGPRLDFNLFQYWPTHTSTIFLGRLIIFEVLARITFYPP